MSLPAPYLPLPPAELAPQRAGAFAARVQARGKFLFAGEDKYWVKGVTYGTFAPGPDGYQFPDRASVERDLAAMAGNGFNALRTYTVPPRWLLDAAGQQGLRVMVGMPWEQNIAFLESASRRQAIEHKVRTAVRGCARHPAVLGFAVGNEIPAPIVRWHGRRGIERFLARLCEIVKEEDPEALATYVNYPTTEYLELPFLDVVCFNVYLESLGRFEAYLARLQNLAGERPLVMAEIGLDSRRHGERAQAESVAAQAASAFAAGCAGTFLFAWTDAWHTGGYEIDDWDFGLTTRERRPKPALAAARRAYAEVPFSPRQRWPRISVVVCSYNGSRTIRETLEGLKRLEYPDFELIVVNDGSTDATPAIAAEYPVRLISTENRGLSSARNTGWQAASGEIVAYIDDDAYPDPHWLHYLAHTFVTTDCAAAGGPNLPPPGDGPTAECVANAPGGPVHVLVSDSEAEHIPGCNMAFRREALAAVGGFDPRFRVAGDDVDLCWRLESRGGRIGFHAGALVWHHRRNSVRAYWRQQKGYGKAEALLEAKWPERFNGAGHVGWSGRIYGRGMTLALPLARPSIYAGVWGSAPYQSLYERAPASLLALPLMPEWSLVIAALAVLSLLALSWPPLAMALPLLGLAALAPIAQAVRSAARADLPKGSGRRVRLQRRVWLCGLHLMQPLARLAGRLAHGLAPWRRRGVSGQRRAFGRFERSRWSEAWRTTPDWIEEIEAALRAQRVPVRRGGDFDAWDLEARCGALGSARARFAVEEHGAGRQLARWRATPRPAKAALAGAAILAALAFGAAHDHGWLAAGVLAAAAASLAWRAAGDCALALGALEQALQRHGYSGR